MVVFAHGSGSGRRSPRNRAVAATLNQAGFGTLLVDLLDAAEAGDRANVFDIDCSPRGCARRSTLVRDDPRLAGLPVGLFGASTGAAAALRAAAAPDVKVSAVVSRGGRPDLAGDGLAAVDAPTLLIVGGRDQQVLELNTAARARMRCRTDLRSCRARVTSSRNRARSARWRPWRRAGSPSTSAPAADRSLLPGQSWPTSVIVTAAAPSSSDAARSTSALMPQSWSPAGSSKICRTAQRVRLLGR